MTRYKVVTPCNWRTQNGIDGGKYPLVEFDSDMDKVIKNQNYHHETGTIKYIPVSACQSVVVEPPPPVDKSNWGRVQRLGADGVTWETIFSMRIEDE